MKLRFKNTEHNVAGVCIENDSGPMYFGRYCDHFVGYGLLKFFVDTHGGKHLIDKKVVFEVKNNKFVCYDY